MMKYTSVLMAVFLVFFTSPIFAKVRFEVVYTDEPGEGFHSRPEARKSVEEAVAEVFSWLDHDADVRIEVKTLMSTSSGLGLAEARTNDVREVIIPGIYYTHLARKILFGVSGWDYDATILVNFDEEYAYGDEVSSEEYDFKAVITHELTHALGFTSWIEADDDDDDDDSTLETVYLDYQRLENEIKDAEHKEILKKLKNEGVPSDFILFNYNLINSGKKSFTYFDTFLVDSEMEKVVDIENLRFVREDLFNLSDLDNEKYLYFLLSKGGKYHMYGLNGMDASHFETGTPTVMQKRIGLGPGIRQWSEVERDIMKALGYKLKPATVSRILDEDK